MELKSQAENHSKEKHNFMQTHTVMKDKDLLRVEALQQMEARAGSLGGSCFLRVELPILDTTASYKSRHGPWHKTASGGQGMSEKLAEALVDGVEYRKN